MSRHTQELLLVLRDVVVRQRAGLPLPDGVVLADLIEQAAEEIDDLVFEVQDRPESW